MKYLYILVYGFFLIGCNNSSSSDNSQNNDSSLYLQQWYMQKNETFYARNDVDADAHIHPDVDTYTKYTGKGVKVAIIDDGFDVSHPEIKDKIIATIAFDSYGEILGSDVNHSIYTEYHGTAVSGIVASADDGIGVRGIAPDVELILIKLPNLFTEIAVKKIFNTAVEHGADIINCSWGTGSVSDVVRDHIDNNISVYGREGKGTIVVFAAGNQNQDITNDESSITTVIGVGATAKDNFRSYTYSNYGKDLDIMAPGGHQLGIATIDPLGKDGSSSDEYNRFDEIRNGDAVSFVGTSASAPIITGAIALLLEKNPNLTRKEIQELLKVSTDTISLNTPYVDEMISSSSQTPTISGLLGESKDSDFHVYLESKQSKIEYGPYSILTNGDGTFESTVSEILPQGDYIIKLLDINDTNIVFATDENFEINVSKVNEKNSSIRKSDFYGYGKINLKKLLNVAY